MSANKHTPIVNGASNDAATWNSPLGQLDAAISAIDSEIVIARQGSATLNTRLASIISGYQAADLATGNSINATLDAFGDQIDNLSLVSTGGVTGVVQANTSTTAVTLATGEADSFVDGARVVYLVGGTKLEYNTVSAASGTSLTLGTVPSGQIDAGTRISQVSDSEYLAATSIKYGNSVLPSLADAVRYAAGNIYHPEAYGAVSGVNVSGATRIANSAAFQAAADAIRASLSQDATGTTVGGGTIFVPADKFYELDGTIRLVQNTWIRGGGTLFNKNATGLPLIQYENKYNAHGVSGVGIDGLTIRGGLSCGGGIHCTHIRMVIQNITGTFAPGDTITTAPDSRTAIVVDQGSSGGHTYLTLRSASGTLDSQTSITGPSGGATVLAGAVYNFYLDRGNFYDLNIFGTSGDWMGGSGFKLDTLGSKGAGYVNWSGCWFAYINDWPMIIRSAGGSGEDNMLIGCTFTRCNGAVYHHGVASPRFYNTRLIQCGKDKDGNHAGRAGLHLLGTRRATIHGCRFEEDSTPLVAYTPGSAGYVPIYGDVSGSTPNYLDIDSCNFSRQTDIVYANGSTVQITRCYQFGDGTVTLKSGTSHCRVIDSPGLAVTDQGTTNQVVNSGNPFYAANPVWSGEVPSNTTATVDLNTVITKAGTYLVRVGTDNSNSAASVSSRGIVGLLLFIKGASSSVLAAIAEVAPTGTTMVASRAGTVITYGTNASVSGRPKLHIIAEQMFGNA